MKDRSRLLCLLALTGATAFAQTSRSSELPTDASLADVSAPAIAEPMTDTAPAESMQLQAKAIAPTPAPRLRSRANDAVPVLPVATVLRLRLVRPISTATARPGEKFFATLTSPVEVNGRTVIPSGTSVSCQVDSAHGGRRLGGRPAIAIRALSAHLPSGEILDFSASVIDTATPRKFDVDQEGRIRGTTFTPMDKLETGSLASAGLIAGAVAAGPAGLFIGAGSGAAVGLGHAMVKHRDLTLPAGTELILQLDAPATTHPAI
jgi:hypothetical protein